MGLVRVSVRVRVKVRGRVRARVRVRVRVGVGVGLADLPLRLIEASEVGQGRLVCTALLEMPHLGVWGRDTVRGWA